MIDNQFIQLLQTYPNALAERKRFAGLLRDFMPGMTLQTNLLLNLYDINIHGELEKAALISNVFASRFVKLLCDDYGVSKGNADWAVDAWCTCYGVAVLGKGIERKPEIVDPPDTATEAKDRTPDTVFDVVANGYVNDWRNVYAYDMLASVHTTFARLITDFFSAFLRVICSVEVVDVKETTYQSFINAIPSAVILAITKMHPTTHFMVIGLYPETVDAMVTIVLGNPSGKRKRVPSDIETILVERILHSIIPLFDKAWETVAKISASIERIETNPSSTQITASGTTVVQITFKVKMDKRDGLMKCCLPLAMVEMLTTHW